MVDKVMKLTDGRNLGYAEYGVPEGVPVLLFHGTPGARVDPFCTILDSMAKTMEGPFVRLIAFDRPGYGLSDVKPERTMADSVSDVTDLVDGLGIEKFSIIAISGGAPYALACSAMMGDRINKAAVLCGLGPVYIPELLKNLSQEETNALKAAVLAPESLISFTQHVQKNPAAFAEHGLRKLSENERKAIPSELIHVSIQMLAEGTKNPEGIIGDYKIYGKDWGIRFEDVKVPVHFWHSASDRTVPISHAEYLVNLIPHSKLTRLNDLSHITTSLASVSNVLDFILKEQE